MPIFDLIWVFMNSGCVLGNIEQKIFIKKITEADQLNFKVSLVRPKLVFTKSQSGFLCGGELLPASPEISSGRGATQQSLVYRMVLSPITRTRDCLGKHFFVIVKKIHDAKCREHIIPKIIQQ